MLGQLGITDGATRTLPPIAGASGAPDAIEEPGSWVLPVAAGAAVVGAAAIAATLLLRGRGGTIGDDAARAVQLVDTGGPVQSKPILLDVGRKVQMGADATDDTIAGWYVSSMRADGQIGLRGMVRGNEHASVMEIAPDALLRNNPSLLVGQLVRHPSPPEAAAAAGWLVDSVDDAASSLVLTREAQRSGAAIDDVVRANIDELRARIELVPGS